MKKRLFAVVFGVLTLFGSAVTVNTTLAATNPYNGACAVQGAGNSSVCQANGSDPLTGSNGTLSKVVNALSLVAGIVSVIFIIVGGIKYIFSGGDASAVSSAKKTVLYAMVGLAVAALARGIIGYVISKI